MRILIAEDNPKLLESLLHIFETNKFVADGVTDGEDALQYALSGEYDGLVLDMMLQKIDGISVLKALRENQIYTPVLFLSAKAEVFQCVEGLDAGADDYLPKPFAVPELMARTRAMLRRKDNYMPELLKYKETSLNRSTYELKFAKKVQSLSGKEFQIMEMFMQRPGSIIPTEQFVTHIWGWETSVDTSVIWVHISNLRKRIDAISAPLAIRFVRNAGYVLEEKG